MSILHKFSHVDCVHNICLSTGFAPRQPCVSIGQGMAKVDEHWTDAVGEAAGKVLEGLATEYDVASDLMRSVAMILIGLAEAVEIAQQQLRAAFEVAATHHLRVHDDGTCAPWDQPDSQGDHGHTEATEWKPKVEAMIRDAVDAANQADTLAADQLARLREGVHVTDTTVSLDDLQGAVSRAQIEMIHFSLPHGQSPEAVAAWWNSLTDAQRRELELAVPVELVDLAGIPNDVKDGFVDPVRSTGSSSSATRWITGTTPASTRLTQRSTTARCSRRSPCPTRGMPENSDWTSSTVFKAFGQTNSWAGSGELHDYLTTKTNSHEVPVTEARPGDVIFLRRGAESGHPEAGDIHHTAIVTSVTPDGVVHYTQHDGSQLNISMQGRERSVEQGLGDQDYIIVRVDPTEK